MWLAGRLLGCAVFWLMERLFDLLGGCVVRRQAIEPTSRMGREGGEGEVKGFIMYYKWGCAV